MKSNLKMLTVAAVGLSVSVLSAKTCTWTGSTGNWSDAANWQDGVLPEDGDDLVVANANGLGGSILLNGATTPKLASLTVSGGSGWNIQDGTFVFMAGTRVVSTPITLKMLANLASDGDVDLVKRGAGTLSIAGGNAMPGRLIVEEGRLQPESEAAYGPVPETYRADAIVLRNGGILGRAELNDGESIVVGPTRGITLDGGGTLCARGTGTLQINAPIVGKGDLTLLRQGAYVVLNAVNSYTGRTLLGAGGDYAYSTYLRLYLGVDGALPATTSLVGVGAGTTTITASVFLEGTTQRFAGLTCADKTRVIFYGPGTARFGTDADDAVAPENVYISAGATLAYAGAGTVTPALTAATGTTFAVEDGSLVLPSDAALSLAALRLAADRTVTLAAGVAQLPNDLVLEGNATLSAAEPALALLGSLTGAGSLTVTGAETVGFGAADATLRVLGAPIVGASVTLDGWVRATVNPAAYAKAKTCTLIGPFSGLEAGDVVLDGTAAGVDDIDQIGASSSVTVQNGGRFVIAAQADMTASNAFAIDAQSRVTVGGSAKVDLSKATFTGGGELNLVGAGVTLVGDLTDVVLNASAAGVVDVPEGQTLTLGSAKGTIRKTGLGTLVFEGGEGETCQLVVEEGLVRAAAPAASLGNVTVRPGARLVLDADEQIANDASVFLDGTLDLNGHTETVQRVHNTPPSGTLRETLTGRLVNTSSSPAVIATCLEDVFYGHVEENPGAIEFRTRAWNTSFFGPAGSAAPSKVVVDETGCYFSYTRFRKLRFYFRKLRDPKQLPALADIQFTYQGRTLPRTLINTIDGNSLASGYQYASLCDGQASTTWKAEKAEDVYVEIQFAGTYPRVDGYRFVPADLASAPTDWDVYAFRAEPSGWFLVDRRRDELVGPANPNWTGFARNPGKTYALSFADRPREQLGPGSTVELVKSGTYRMRVSSLETLALGALSGAGDVQIEDGSWIAPGDMSGWTGSFIFQSTAGRENMARVLLDAGLGDAAQTVRVKGANTNVSVENAGAAPVSLLVDDATASTRLRLADGSGPMGLVKRGAGTVALAIDESANTGPTAVEAGTLKVVGPLGAERLAKPVRYFRFTPTCVVGGATYKDDYGYNWGAGDIQLLDAEGEVAPWPEGTTISAPSGGHETAKLACLIDGNPATRGLVKNPYPGTGTAELPPVTIDTKTGVAFVGYRWYTSNGSSDKNRTPTNWILETSDDGEAWTVVSTASQTWGGSDATSTANLRGPFTRDGVVRAASTLATLPKDFFAVETNRATRAPALKARYFRFAPHETYDPLGYEHGYGWMVSEFSLFRKAARVNWPAGTSATVTGGAVNENNGSNVKNICNNVTDGRVDSAPFERIFVTQMPSWVEIDAGEEVVFDGYGFYSAASGGYTQRIPVSWTFSISADGTTWHEVDNRVQERETVTLKEYTLQGIWSVADKFPLLDAADATDALGDASPVAIASGATLEIDSVYEKFGTLSGAGTLKVNSGVVAEVNACVDGSFSGAVMGAGTLAFCGTATQMLSNATFRLPKLELNGGVVTGTASHTGDLSITFNEGAWSGTLAVSGKLTATGTPRFAVPTPAAGGAIRQTLFIYGSIDAASAEVLKSAEIVGELPAGLKAKIHVGDGMCVLTAAADGSVILFR